MGRKTNYTPSPVVGPEELARLAAIVEVLAGIKTVSAAARTLNLSRNHFQTLLNRGVTGLVTSIAAKPPGRPTKAKAVVTLERELKRLERANARLSKRVEATERLLQVASGLLHGRIRPRRRSVKASSRDEGADSEPEPGIERTLVGIDEMIALGVNAPLAAAVAGVHPATVRRWRARVPQPLPHPPTRRARVDADAARQVSGLVRALKGLVGAESLRHSVSGVSRRQAARVKAEVLTEMERERKAQLRRVQVSVPGVLRGMDGVHFHGARRPFWALVSADGAVPYRTSVTAGARYDAALVAQAIAADFDRNGAPLVYRVDRARAHDAPRVRAVLDAHQVLVLHGPPCCPRYYGQLERQNREHRGWSDALRELCDEELEPRLREMLAALNGLWRRRTLAWQTAAEVWDKRPRLNVDRQALREEVEERAIRISRALTLRGKPADLAERLAIEQTLELKGYLRVETGGWC